MFRDNRTPLLLCLIGALASPACFTSGGGMMMPPPLMVTNTAPPAALAGQAFSFSIQVTGGTAPYTLTESTMLFPGGMGANGTPCQGLMINFTTGAVTGTPVNSGTCGPVNFTVTDSSTPTLTFQFSLTFRVAGVLAITTATLPNGTEGVAYNQTVATTGGATPLAFSISVGALPPGLMLNTTTGAITGTPTMGGTFNFTIRATDSLTPAQAVTQAYTVRILQITTMALPDGAAGQAYNQVLAATGEIAPLMWALAPGSGPLPPGLTLDAATGTISGPPTTPGTFNFSVQATDSDNPPRSDTQALSVRIVAPLVINTATLPNGTEATGYNQTVMTGGGFAPINFAVTAGALPPGVMLNMVTGALVGIPTTGGTFNFTITATDSFNPAQTDAQAYSVLILQITTATTPIGIVGQAYNTALSVAGQVGNVTWALAAGSGPLPNGLMLDATGNITGIPTLSGTFSFTVQVTDSDAPPRTATKGLSIAIAPQLQITNAELDDAVEGVPYTDTVMTLGGVAPITFNTVGALPPGLMLNPNSGAVTGTPQAGGAYNFSVTATDSLGQTATEPYVILVLEIITPLLPDGTVGVLYGSPLPVFLLVTGEIPPVTFTHSAGTLPPGVMLNPDGSFLGTPTTPGSFAFSVQATDSGANPGPRTHTRTYLINIRGAADLSITKADAPDPIQLGQGNVAYTITVTNNGPNPATNVVVEDMLDPSFNFVSSNPMCGPDFLNPFLRVCSLGTLNSGASVVVQIVVTPTIDGTFPNIATVSADDFDPDPSNNSDTENTTVTTGPPPPATQVTDIHVTRTAGPSPFSSISTFRHDAVANTLTIRMPPPPATFPIPYPGTQPGPITGDNSLIAVGEADVFDLDFNDGFVTFFTGDGQGNFTQDGAPIPVGSLVAALAFDPAKTLLFASVSSSTFEQQIVVINVASKTVVNVVPSTMTSTFAATALLANPDPSLRMLYGLGSNASPSISLFLWTYDLAGNLFRDFNVPAIAFPNSFAIKNQRLYIGTNASGAMGQSAGLQYVVNLVAGLPAGNNFIGPIGGGGLFGEAVVRDAATGAVCKYTADGGGNLRVFSVNESTLVIMESLLSPFPAQPGEFFFLPVAHPTQPIIYVFGVGMFDPDGPGPIPALPAAVLDVFNVDTQTCDVSNPAAGALRALVPGPPGPISSALVVPQ